MKTYLPHIGCLLACQLAVGAQPGLPASAPGPFAPVPAKITAGPEAPATPMEPKAPTLDSCKNAAAVLKKLAIKLTAEQKTLIDKQRFLLVPIERTSVAEALPESDEDRQWAFTNDEMLQAFSYLGGDQDPLSRTSANTRLITPDLVLHAWHRGFSRTLEYIEQRRLHEVLETFLAGTLANVREMRATATGPAKDRLAWTEARFAAAWVLLGPASPPDKGPPTGDDQEDADQPGAAVGGLLGAGIIGHQSGHALEGAAVGPKTALGAAIGGAISPTAPEAPAAKKKAPPEISYEDSIAQRLTEARKNLPNDVSDALTGEVSLVLAATGMKPSPLFGKLSPTKPADYSQFKPRSHYTKNATLGGYFRAMMFLGRNSYELKNTDAIGDATLAAMAMAKPSADGKSPLAAWQDLMEVTGFFAGQSDDITYTEYQKWLSDSLGATALDPATAISDETIKKLSAELTKLRPPMIVSSPHADLDNSPDSDPPSFRICGQRFTWDARVLDRLTRGAPKEMPTTPTAVMVVAAMGDAFAEGIAKKSVASNPTYTAEFAKRLPEIRKELDGVTDDQWFSSMAAKQLQVISTLARPRNANFPAFMSNDAFRAKNIESMLGSFTELKHDTVLYAKQVYAEMGEGGESDKMPPLVKGLVQPDVPFWREMERLAIFAADGFARHKLLPDGDENFSRFKDFARDIGKFRMIAEKHVAGTPLTADDWETIRTIDLSYIARPLVPYDEPKPGDGKCALITDILTDANAGTALCEGLGRPYIMLAMVGGKDGYRLLAGLAYNHYEFSQPLAQGRLTDEEWQNKIYVKSPKLPNKPAWSPPAVKPTIVPPPKE